MIVGKVVKQPDEIETYSITYNDDLGDTENIVTSRNALFNERKMVARKDVAAPYTALAAEANYLYRVTAVGTVTLPVGLPDGTEFYVSNHTVVSDVIVSCSEKIDGATTSTVNVNEAVALRRVGGTWITVASTNTLVVDSADDHRVRIFFYYGTDKDVYIVEVTVDTDEGRRLQDELRVTVKEVK